MEAITDIQVYRYYNLYTLKYYYLCIYIWNANMRHIVWEFCNSDSEVRGSLQLNTENIITNNRRYLISEACLIGKQILSGNLVKVSATCAPAYFGVRFLSNAMWFWGQSLILYSMHILGHSLFKVVYFEYTIITFSWNIWEHFKNRSLELEIWMGVHNLAPCNA